MKKWKCMNVLKRILISILCTVTIFFSMPVKSSAGPFQDFIELILDLPDALMVLLNEYIAQREADTFININLKGIEAGSGDSGRVYNFMVTPYEITNGNTVTYKDRKGNDVNVINIPLLNANFFSTNTANTNNLETGSQNQTQSNDILRPAIGGVYKSLRNFCMIAMMLVLLYIGIKIMISSTAEQQSKYKKNSYMFL